MMGRLKRDQGQFFYSFCLDEVVPDDHRIREIAGVLAPGEAQCLRSVLLHLSDAEPKVAQQVGGPDAKLAVFIEKASVEFFAREALDLRQQLAESRFFRTAKLVIIAQVAQRLPCDGANHLRDAII
jgi:hypothetical protein